MGVYRRWRQGEPDKARSFHWVIERAADILIELESQAMSRGDRLKEAIRRAGEEYSKLSPEQKLKPYEKKKAEHKEGE